MSVAVLIMSTSIKDLESTNVGLKTSKHQLVHISIINNENTLNQHTLNVYLEYGTQGSRLAGQTYLLELASLIFYI